jgi:prohibitin 1
VIGEGTHFRIPLLEYPKIFDVRLRPRVLASRTGTKDLQQVQISLRVLSRPLEDKLPVIYQNLGEDFDERVLPSIVTEVLKAVVAQFDAEQLLTQREKVSKQIRQNLSARALEFNLLLEDVSITHLIFSKEFTTAIEAKQVAQQDAERSKFIVAKAEQEKLAAIIIAQGESEAAELISKALKENGTGMIEVKRIDAAKEVASVLSSSRNVAYVPSGGGGGSNLLMSLPPLSRNLGMQGSSGGNSDQRLE